jgi:dsRNA-specific ribonuclease
MRRLRLCVCLAECRPTRTLQPLNIRQLNGRRYISIEATQPALPTRSTPDILESNRPSNHILESALSDRINAPNLFGESLRSLERLPSPHPSAALQSAKLSALHARLYLPPSFPLQTLARCLVHRSADPDPRFNNAALAALGRAQLCHLMTEHLICRYPRLPTSIIFVALEAYIGSRALSDMTRSWGVDAAAAPGGEVEPGLLQFSRDTPNEPTYEVGFYASKRTEEKRQLLPTEVKTALEEKEEQSPVLQQQRKSRALDVLEVQTSAKVMLSDQFGYPVDSELATTTSIEDASSNFVFAMVGALHLHLGRAAVKTFFADHVMSRQLDISKLFTFKVPNRDLLLLCKREGFEAPVPRLISETGRLSSHPVFVVGIYSGLDKLGEGAGGSIKEAKIRATIAALKGWYLYSPAKFVKPSEAEAVSEQKKWVPNYVDCGEVIC